MSIKITRGDYTIEVNTEDELRVVLNTLDRQRRGVSINPKDFVTDIETLFSVYKRIPKNSNAGKVLSILKNRVDGVPAEELASIIGASNLQALGGILGSIGRYAKEFGVKADQEIYRWEQASNLYRLTDDMARAISEDTK